MCLAGGADHIGQPVAVQDVVCASLAVALDRAAIGDLGRVRRLGLARFTAAVRRELPRWGGSRPCLRIVRGVFTALADPAGVQTHRLGGLERAELALDDWREARRRLTEVETRMVAVLDELGLTDLVGSIAGLTTVGAAAILAETGDPGRFHSPRAVVKHAGLCPRDNASGAHQGKTPISSKGRPALRLAASRAIWAALSNNPGAGRPIHLPDHPRAQSAGPTTSPHRLRGSPPALAARRRHPQSALGPGHRRRHEAAARRRLTVHIRLRSDDLKPGRGKPDQPSRNQSRAEAWAAPLVSSTNSIARCRDQPDYQRGRARGDGRRTRPPLDYLRYGWFRRRSLGGRFWPRLDCRLRSVAVAGWGRWRVRVGVAGG